MLSFVDRVWRDHVIAMMDVESTGLDPMVDHVVEMAVVRGSGGVIIDRWSTLVRPPIPIPEESIKIHGITNDMVASSPTFEQAFEELRLRVNGCLPAAYNQGFDRAFIGSEYLRCGYPKQDVPKWLTQEVEWIDPLTIARVALPRPHGHKLVELCVRLGISLAEAHRAVEDAEAALHALYAFEDQKIVSLPKTYGLLIQRQRYHQAKDQASYQEWLQRQPEDRRFR